MQVTTICRSDTFCEERRDESANEARVVLASRHRAYHIKDDAQPKTLLKEAFLITLIIQHFYLPVIFQWLHEKLMDKREDQREVVPKEVHPALVLPMPRVAFVGGLQNKALCKPLFL